LSALSLSPLTALHLLCVDLAAAGPLLCIWLRRREVRAGDVIAGETGRRLAWWSVAALVAGIAIGLVRLGLYAVDDSQWWTAFLAVPRSRLWFGLAELGFSLACLATVAVLWQRLRPKWQYLLLLLAATNLLYHFPPLFAAVRLAAAETGAAGEWTKAELFSRMFSTAALARVAHVWASSLIVAAAAVTWLGGRQAGGARLSRSSARLALIAAILQIPLGLWLLTSTSPAARDGLLFGDLFAGLLFTGGVAAVLMLLHALLALALGDEAPSAAWRAAALTVVVVLLMAAAAARSQDAAVHGDIDVSGRADCGANSLLAPRGAES
jgi:hypothetical protein